MSVSCKSSLEYMMLLNKIGNDDKRKLHVLIEFRSCRLSRWVCDGEKSLNWTNQAVHLIENENENEKKKKKKKKEIFFSSGHIRSN